MWRRFAAIPCAARRAGAGENFSGASPGAPSLPQSPALWNFFFGGNTLVRVGVIVLFFGVAFLLK